MSVAIYRKESINTSMAAPNHNKFISLDGANGAASASLEGAASPSLEGTVIDAEDEAVPKQTEPTSSIARRLSRHTGIGNARNTKHSDPDAQPLSSDAIASLGGLEAEVLGILWEIGRAATGMEVMETALYKARALGNEPPSFSTIATTLRRLTGKGLLNSEKREGRTPVFWPTVEREQMAARILNNVSAILLGVSLHSLLPRLIGRTVPGLALTGEKHSKKEASNRHPELADEEEIARLLQALEETAARNMRGKLEE